MGKKADKDFSYCVNLEKQLRELEKEVKKATKKK